MHGAAVRAWVPLLRFSAPTAKRAPFEKNTGIFLCLLNIVFFIPLIFGLFQRVCAFVLWCAATVRAKDCDSAVECQKLCFHDEITFLSGIIQRVRHGVVSGGSYITVTASGSARDKAKAAYKSLI